VAFGLLTQLLNSVSDSEGKQGLCMRACRLVWALGFISLYQIHTCFCQVSQPPSLKFLTLRITNKVFVSLNLVAGTPNGCRVGDSNLNKVDS